MARPLGPTCGRAANPDDSFLLPYGKYEEAGPGLQGGDFCADQAEFGFQVLSGSEMGVLVPQHVRFCQVQAACSKAESARI